MSVETDPMPRSKSNPIFFQDMAFYILLGVIMAGLGELSLI